MTLSIMQPYFLPYLGYWQMIAAADTFILYDDVNFIKGGWINRNQYLYQGQAKFFNVTMSGASPNKKINEVELMPSPDQKLQRKLLSTFQMAYKKAPQYETVMPLLEDIVLHEESNLSRYIEYSIRKVCSFLDIPTKILVSSEIPGKDTTLPREQKLIALCHMFHADTYINPTGGRELYAYEDFAAEGIKLLFIRMKDLTYPQFGDSFVPYLSIVDVLMFHDQAQMKELLKEYTLT